MSVLKMSGPVRRQLGGNTADALAAGVGLPADAQCWQCGQAINMLAARPGSVTLSVVAVALVSVTTFGHAEHTTSRVFTEAQYRAVASDKPSPVAGGDSNEAMLVDGRPVAVVAGDPAAAGPPAAAGEDGTAGEDGGAAGEDGDRLRGIRDLSRAAGDAGAALRDLARRIHAADDDEQALRIMQEATGLTITDPQADRAELDRRVAAAVIRAVRCPGCAQLPDMVLSPSQAFCGNDECSVLQFDPSIDPAEQWANGTQIGPLVGEGGIPQQVADYHAAMRAAQVRGSAEDDGREQEIREFFHRYGYRCADDGGVCRRCGHDGRPNPVTG